VDDPGLHEIDQYLTQTQFFGFGDLSNVIGDGTAGTVML
jgi:hypothetical protein